MVHVSVLDQIVQNKIKEVDSLLSGITKSCLKKTANDKRIPLDFKSRLKTGKLSIIAEVKKASPSKGMIRPDFNPLSIAQSYQTAGASCISVLTETKYFHGSPEFLKTIKQNVGCPLLRKDFIVDIRQIRESYDLGADAILLIVAILNQQQLKDFSYLAREFGLTCLVEVHSYQELELALALDFDLIGVNNRNLTTFVTDISHSLAMIKDIPNTKTTISESGIKTPEDCLRLQNAGFDAVLVGETLMKQPDVAKALADLMSKIG